MNRPSSLAKRSFSSHENPRVNALEGLPLATFWQRTLGYWIDLFFAVLLWFPAEVGWRRFVLHEQIINIKWDFHEVGNIIIALIYFGFGNYWGNGQTPGKWIARTRAMSLKTERMGAWQSIERVPWLWRRSARRGARFLAVLLGSQPHVRPGPVGGDDRCGCEKTLESLSKSMCAIFNISLPEQTPAKLQPKSAV